MAERTNDSQGSGAGQAVEDSLFVSQLLTSHSVLSAPISSRGAQIQKALEAYNTCRHERGTRIVTTSREAGLMYEFRGEYGDDVKRIGRNLEERMQWSEFALWSFSFGDFQLELEWSGVGTDGMVWSGNSLGLGYSGST